MSIALIKNGSVEVGVTLNPINDDIYSAEKGKGAYLNDRVIRVSSRINQPVISLNKGYSEEADLKYRQITEKISPVLTIRRFGSAALELCWVAAGTVEGFIDFGDELWDFAAGVLMVSEAGGRVTDWKGNPWSIENKYVLATNSLVHDKIKNLIANLQ